MRGARARGTVSSVSHRVFVYGSLLGGLRYHHHLGGAPRVVETATRRAFGLLDLGAYPAAIDGGTVPLPAVPTPLQGEVYDIDDGRLAHLDAFEGCPHLFVRRRAPLVEGPDAWLYVLHPSHARAALADGAALVEAGSWRRWLARHPSR